MGSWRQPCMAALLVAEKANDIGSSGSGSSSGSVFVVVVGWVISVDL